jgi:hypothetical protein
MPKYHVDYTLGEHFRPHTEEVMLDVSREEMYMELNE